MQGWQGDLGIYLTTLQNHGQGLATECAIRTAQYAPVGKGETAGRLRDSLRGEVELTGDGMTLTVLSDVPEAEWVIEGTPAHHVYPKFARALFWEGAAHPVGGNEKRGTGGVEIPEHAPNDFGEQAQSDIEDAIDSELETVQQEAFEAA